VCGEHDLELRPVARRHDGPQVVVLDAVDVGPGQVGEDVGDGVLLA
jgi:hypothetical protein